MTTFICIPNGTETEIYLTDTDEEIAAAKDALADAELSQAPVFVGDPDGDHHKNGQILFA